MKYDVVVIAGPSGSGKNSVRAGVLEACSSCVKLITACTRPMRPGEVDGVDYFFMSNEEFFKLVDSGDIPEYNEDQWRETGTTRGVYLPELRKQIDTGKTVMAQLQLQGLEYMREHFNTVGIFIEPSSLDELEKRITSRADLSSKELQSRLDIARDEIENQSHRYDHRITNENGKLDEAIKQVLDIIE